MFNFRLCIILVVLALTVTASHKDTAKCDCEVCVLL
jgi:hypothetical protein